MEKLIPDKTNRIPFDQWGKDHWSTLLYIEVCVVDNGGKLDPRKMRCNPSIHPEFRTPDIHSVPEPGVDDDWSCVEDMIVDGLLNVYVTYYLLSPPTVHVELTDYGWQLAGVARQEKAERGRKGQ